MEMKNPSMTKMQIDKMSILTNEYCNWKAFL
jgi:hypothetical protein